jgi:hypothetical protein
LQREKGGSLELEEFPKRNILCAKGNIMEKTNSKPRPSRRAFMKKAAYAAPIILTLSAAPSLCKAGSGKEEDTRQRPGMKPSERI